MTDLVDAMMGALGLVDRIVKLRQQQRARAALEDSIEIDAEIDGLAEIDRIRAEAGLPYRGWPSTRRPTRGRWSPASPRTEAPGEPPATEPPPKPPSIDLDLGPREHVEGDHNAPEVVDAEIIDAEVVDAEVIDAEIIDAEIVVAKPIDDPSPAPSSPFAFASGEPRSAEQLDLFADFAARGEGPEEADEASTVAASSDEAPAATTPVAAAETTIETPIADPAPIAADPEPSAEVQALRDALMTAEAARARPAEARRLYEEVLLVAARPSAPFPQTLYAALALLGTSECDLELGDLDAAMANSGDAWAWARRAHGQHPSDETLQVLSLTAQTHAQTAERSGDRQQLTEVLAECLSVIEPELAHRDLPAAREVRLGLRSRLMTVTRPSTSLARKGALTPSSTLIAMQGVRP